MNLIFVMAVATVTVISSSGKEIKTSPNIARSCIVAVGEQGRPMSDSPAWRRTVGDTVIECIRVQNELAKKK